MRGGSGGTRQRERRGEMQRGTGDDTESKNEEFKMRKGVRV